MSERLANPFPPSDRDRYEIWQMLVQRDIDAFLAADWSRVAGDFAESEFVGYDAGRVGNPDHWRVAFPTLASYRDEWLRQAQTFRRTRLRHLTNREFLRRATILRDIEIAGGRAVAHKKFNGQAEAEDGRTITLAWQTLYFLRCDGGRWRIAGFLGYLPNPMGAAAGRTASRTAGQQPIRLPPGARQHEGAGPYSPVLEVHGGRLIAISGQGPISEDGKIAGETLEEQAIATLENCRKALGQAGAALADVFKVMVYLGDMKEWAAFNEVYKRYFSPPYPVRTAIQAVLWGGIKVEIDMLAALPA